MNLVSAPKSDFEKANDFEFDPTSSPKMKENELLDFSICNANNNIKTPFDDF
jgi:hypothetical protein